MFDERIAFNLPRKWEFIEEKDKDGDKSFKICYNISRNSDGERQAEETYNVMKRQKKGSLVSNVDGNYPVQVVGFAKDFSIGVSVGTSGGSGGYRSSSNSQIKFKIYTGLAVIEYGDSYYLISTMNLGEDDYKSSVASQSFFILNDAKYRRPPSPVLCRGWTPGSNRDLFPSIRQRGTTSPGSTSGL